MEKPIKRRVDLLSAAVKKTVDPMSPEIHRVELESPPKKAAQRIEVINRGVEQDAVNRDSFPESYEHLSRSTLRIRKGSLELELKETVSNLAANSERLNAAFREQAGIYRSTLLGDLKSAVAATSR